MALLFPFPETALVAHRGAHCCGSDENSLAAIEHAVELAVPGIEVDVCNWATVSWCSPTTRMCQLPEQRSRCLRSA